MKWCNKCGQPAVLEYSLHWDGQKLEWVRFLPYCEACDPLQTNPPYRRMALSMGQFRWIDGREAKEAPRPRYPGGQWLDCDRAPVYYTGQIANTDHIDVPVSEQCKGLPLFAGL